MAESAFDTPTVARDLEKNHEFAPGQVGGAAATLHRHLVGHLATKDGIGNPEARLTERIARLEDGITERTARMIADLRAEMPKPGGMGIGALFVSLKGFDLLIS